MTRLLVADNLRGINHLLSIDSNRPLISVCVPLIIKPKPDYNVNYSGFAAYKRTRMSGAIQAARA